MQQMGRPFKNKTYVQYTHTHKEKIKLSSKNKNKVVCGEAFRHKQKIDSASPLLT